MGLMIQSAGECVRGQWTNRRATGELDLGSKDRFMEVAAETGGS